MRKLLVGLLLLALPAIAPAQDIGGLFRIASGVLSNKVSTANIYLTTSAGDTVKIGTFINLSQFDSTKIGLLIVGNQAFPTTLGPSGYALKSNGSAVTWQADATGTGYWAMSPDSFLTVLDPHFYPTDTLIKWAKNGSGTTLLTNPGNRFFSFGSDSLYAEIMKANSAVRSPAFYSPSQNLGLYAVSGYDVRVGLNRNNGFSIYGTPSGTSERWAFNDSTLATLNGIITGLIKQQFAGSAGSGYIVLNGDSINDWSAIIPDSAVVAATAWRAKEVDTLTATAMIAAVESRVGEIGNGLNPDSLYGKLWAGVPGDSGVWWYNPVADIQQFTSWASLRTTLGVGSSTGGIFDSSASNPNRIFWFDGTDTVLVVVDNGDTSQIYSVANNNIKIGNGGSGDVVVTGRTLVIEDLEGDANGIPDSTIDHPLEYLELSIVHGLGHYTEDSAEIRSAVHASTSAWLFTDTTVGGSGGKDSVMVTVTIPWDCTLDSAIFTYDVIDGDIDSLGLRGPDRSAFVNMLDSAYASITTGWNATSATRVAISLSSISANAGEKFGILFFNNFDAANDRVRIGCVQLAVQR